MFRPFAKSLDLTLGRCPKCMHEAFLVALGAWVLTFVIIAFDGTFWLSALIAIAASSLTALWLAHISAFALRRAIAVGHSTRDIFAQEPSATCRAYTVQPAQIYCRVRAGGDLRSHRDGFGDPRKYGSCSGQLRLFEL